MNKTLFNNSNINLVSLIGIPKPVMPCFDLTPT